MNIDVKFRIRIKDIEIELNVAEFQELKRVIEETSSRLQENRGIFPGYPNLPDTDFWPASPYIPNPPTIRPGDIRPGDIRYGKDTITSSCGMTIEIVDGKKVIQR